jgi:hypothetical protein
MNRGRASILITPQTRDVLRSRGRKGQTYDDIVNELLKKEETSLNVVALNDIKRSQ